MPTAIKTILALLGFAGVWMGAWNASRLNLEGSIAGPWDWAGLATLPLAAAAGCFVARWIFSGVHGFATSPIGDQTQIPAWLVKGVSDRAAARDAAGLRALASEVDRMKGQLS